jgi:hypothetical protein
VKAKIGSKAVGVSSPGWLFREKLGQTHIAFEIITHSNTTAPEYLL